MSILLVYGLYGIALGLLLFIAFLFVAKATASLTDKRRLQLDFLDTESDKMVPFPSIHSAHTLDLTIVIPAYNESKRLPVFLDVLFPYLDGVDYSYEIIVVDDGSKDTTTEVVHSYSKKYGSNVIRCMKLPANKGKGGAVRQGVLSARGKEILFADADGATDINDLGKVRKSLHDLLNKSNTKYGIAVGSRAHLQDEAVANRSLLRNILMYGFHMFVFIVGGISNIKDTQCGFKLFSRSAAQAIFPQMNIERWAFDVEIFVIANILGIRATEVAVNWEEIDGSKIVPIYSWLEMAKDLLMIRTRYMIGAWSVNQRLKAE